MIDGAQPAFSEVHIYHWRGQDKESGETDNVLPRWNGGLTKREYFAGLAMQGLLANPIHSTDGIKINGQKINHDKAAIFMADALIAELSK